MKQKEFYNLKDLKKIIEQKKSEKVLLITSKSAYNKTNAKEIISKLNIKLDIFNDFEVNPNIKDIKKGINFAKNKKYGLVVALGGGSVIDTAKLINFFYLQNFKIEDFIKNKKQKIKKTNPLVAVPTTIGTGSEATKFAVLYVKNKKHSIEHEKILPEFVILDYKLTKTIPKNIAASSGMDALCQGIESYWCVNSSKQSKEYAKKAIQLSLKHIKKAVNNKNENSLKNMLIAANYSGKAINLTKTTAPHALSYYLTNKYKISHGHAVALIMPYFLEKNYEVNLNNINDKRGIDYVKKTMNEIYSFFGTSNYEECKNEFKKLMKDIKLESNLNKYITLTKLYKHVNQERLKNNPVT